MLTRNAGTGLTLVYTYIYKNIIYISQCEWIDICEIWECVHPGDRYKTRFEYMHALRLQGLHSIPRSDWLGINVTAYGGF